MRKLLSIFRSRKTTPIEERSYANFYILVSGLLFVSTMWAVLDEVTVRRPWKEYQSRYYKLSAQKLHAQYEEAIKAIDNSTVETLRGEVAKSRRKLESEEYLGALEKHNALELQLAEATRDWRFARSNSDAAYYQYKSAEHEGHPVEKLKRNLDEIDKEVEHHSQRMREISGELSAVSGILHRYKNEVDSLELALKNLYDEANKLKTKMERLAASPIEVKQVIINDFDKSNFGEVKARVDRCQTCHTGYGDTNMADESQPFRTHPQTELLQIHNPEKFGCTPCHRGQGPALTVGDAHGDADPYWETPLLRGKDVYASCNSCHYNQQVLRGAPYFSKAKQILLESGCYGCHEIKGYTSLPKIGPELNALPAKVKADWVYRWVRNPKEYNPHTRMPNFKLNEEQAGAVTAYLFSIGKEAPFALERPRGAYAGGSVLRGKEIVDAVGCKGCHVVGNDTRVRDARATSYDIAPELTHAAGKLNPDWIFDWIKNPRHYNPTTRMPNLRLTDGEARDVVAFIMTLKEDRPVEKVNLDLNSSEKISRGAAVIREFGCFACHEIKGMENEGKVSVNLSDFGRKKVEQMDFGDTKVRHVWADWVWSKLKNSRVFETERIVQKMPVFSFSDDETGMLRMLLLSFRNDVPAQKYHEPLTRRVSDVEEGQKLTVRYGCINCHQIEERGGFFSSLLNEPTLGPPMITIEGGKVQEQWLHSFLTSPTSIRPWLKVRMPTFSLSEDEINVATRYFLALSKEDFQLRDYSAFRPDPKLLPQGKSLFVTFQCIKCHQLGGETIDPKSVAPNLELARNRLKPDWILRWLENPEAIQPGTMMPGYFPDGQSPLPDVLNGDAKLQMTAIRDYLFTLGRKK